MKLKKYIIITLTVALTSCSLDEVWYDRVVPETFFKTEGDVLAALYRPFTHARWYLTGDRWIAQEFSADHFARTTKGRHWYDGGRYARYQHHEWTPDESQLFETWRGTLQGVALALDVKQDLGNLDYQSLALTEEDKAAHLGQLDALTAFFYLRGLDFFGGLPIFTSLDQENVPRSSDQETFNHIEGLLKQAIIDLPEREVGAPLEGAMTKGAAALMLARLYFNSEAYTGVDMFEEAAKISQELLDGEYGVYSLDPDWKGPHNFTNNLSTEIIWSIPSEFNRLEYTHYGHMYHYNSRVYFDVDLGSNNGTHLQPSRKPNGDLYMDDFKLGSPYEKYEDEDLRKRPYKYLGNSNYEGMFLVGDQVSPITGDQVMGNEEYNGKPLVFVDQVGRFSELGQTYSSVEELPSNIGAGEENTGVRLVKIPIPSSADLSLRWGADHPAFRLAEVYLMLAECMLRSGDSERAAELINEVRRRAFEDGMDPNPATSGNLDLYRMADEWGIEFLGEGRRRTDLVRLGFFTTEEWWDHQPSGSDHLNRFPVPTSALSASNVLEQNPGY
ncbi:RagB/SusD family nutrient uptake outer membrane protein [Algoriphagus resistens]|uniref:RagB/SusD family nutrient uptake outer membrane protein n=1 Tax=Algoriphagus resistens TaxID=1750590 RepID=UPI000716AA97|nr:RagB/SusD family nutrient uptake outer membrane protein [Algoriphagus resistens]